ncbi:MAG: TIGR03960 family B12-binding radical SAM protein [Syntrophobacterales bacterium]|nr:TIGR03960 family B12-binding radical SAM protein [Syntrophobacterales bacterium]
MDTINLLEVTKPGRYVGLEWNAARKGWDETDVRWVLAFPDVYEVGFSHLGLRLLYRILNNAEGVLADRVYTPWPDMEGKLKDSGISICGIETGKPLLAFDIVGISLQYELGYTNILTMLDLAGIPMFATDREEGHPMVVAGGPCAFNAEPVADFFDFIVLGEGEEIVLEITKKIRDWKRVGGKRRELLEELRHIRGVYIPSFFSFRFRKDGTIEEIRPLYSDYQNVSKGVLYSLDSLSPFPTCDLVPAIEVVHDRLNVEIARGCSRGCRFCQAGYIYRPVRERSPSLLLRHIKENLKKTGYEEISLLSLSAGDYSSIESLIQSLLPELISKRVALSLPSLRVGTLTSEMMEMIRSVRKTGFTLAPEAGTERLRRLINKPIDTQALIETAERAFSLGWRLIKLYFMIGLPGETDEDLKGIVDLVKALWEKGKPFKAGLHIGVSTFVPKPHTPFQWYGQIPFEEVGRRLSFIREGIKRFRGIELKWHDPKQSFWEAVLARGDRRLGKVVLGAWLLGARMDGWTELFKDNLWHEAARKENINPAFFAHREIRVDEILPWDHISCGVSKEFLLKERERALFLEWTPDCRWGRCSNCGVCDFRDLKPNVSAPNEKALEGVSEMVRSKLSEDTIFWYNFIYEKTRPAHYIGQNDFQRLMARSIRRAGIPVAFSKGFHPHPRISFDQALPVGIESLCEEGWIGLTEVVSPEEIMERWNRELPEGIKIRMVKSVSKRGSEGRTRTVTYLIEGLSVEDRLRLRKLWNVREECIVPIEKSKGTIEITLNDWWKGFREEEKGVLVTLLEGPNHVMRPKDLLSVALVKSLGGLRIVKVAVHLRRIFSEEKVE